MRKKQQCNPEKDMHRDLEYLEKKLGEEKQNLVRQNKKLQKQIHQQIEENRLLKQSYQKKQQTYQQKIQSLNIENENLKTQLLLSNQNEDHELQFEKKLKETCDAYKMLTNENEELKAKLQEYAELIAKMEEDINQLEKDNSKYKRKIKDDQQEIKNLAKEIGNNKEYYKELQKQSEKTVDQLERQIQSNAKLEASLTQLKKKNKQFNVLIRELEERLELVTRKQQQQFDHQIAEIRRQKEEIEKSVMQKERQIQFLRISVNQKSQYGDNLNRQLQELRHNYQNIARQHSLLTSNLQKVENENRRLQIEQEKQKSKAERELEEVQKNHQQQLNKFKRKTAEQVSSIFRTGGDSKVIENYLDGLRSHKSQMNLRINPSAPLLKTHQEKFHIPFEKLKYETQISNLHSEIESLKKQLQFQSIQLNRFKKLNEQQKNELQNRQSKIKQLGLQNDKLDNDKRIEQDRHYKELTKYRNIQTELLENRRNTAEMQEAINLKIAYYDKKIKEYIDAIDRKDGMIQNLKIQRLQAQNKAKFMQQKLVKSIQEGENLKKFKNDTIRKEELLKDYKQKIQKYKNQIQSSKAQAEKLKKQKNRLQRNLESKEQYINSLKAKSQKQDIEKQSKIKQAQSAALLNLKEKYEAKLKKLKKQVQEFQIIIQSMRSVIAEKIQQAIRKAGAEIPVERKSWEAAELLGLKSSQIQEFVNPTAHLDRNICEDLDGLWQSGKYQEFMRSSIEYIILKNQTDDANTQ